MEANPDQAYKVSKRMGARPGDEVDNGGFELPEYFSLGLSAEQCPDRLAQAFADISQHFPALDPGKLPLAPNISLKGNQTPFIIRIKDFHIFQGKWWRKRLYRLGILKGGSQGIFPKIG